jgi:hypothetical protein
LDYRKWLQNGHWMVDFGMDYMYIDEFFFLGANWLYIMEQWIFGSLFFNVWEIGCITMIWQIHFKV